METPNKTETIDVSIRENGELMAMVADVTLAEAAPILKRKLKANESIYIVYRNYGIEEEIDPSTALELLKKNDLLTAPTSALAFAKLAICIGHATHEALAQINATRHDTGFETYVTISAMWALEFQKQHPDFIGKFKPRISEDNGYQVEQWTAFVFNWCQQKIDTINSSIDFPL